MNLRYLRPEDFLDAKDLTVLKYDIKHKLQYRDELDDGHWIKVDKYNYDYFDVIDSDLKIPQEFIDKWRELLGMKRHQVVNPRYVKELIEHSDKTELIGGYALNRHLHTDCYREYSLPGEYYDVYFDPNKSYKCYVRLDDHDWSAPTQTNVLYIEGF